MGFEGRDSPVGTVSFFFFVAVCSKVSVHYSYSYFDLQDTHSIDEHVTGP